MGRTWGRVLNHGSRVSLYQSLAAFHRRLLGRKHTSIKSLIFLTIQVAIEEAKLTWPQTTTLSSANIKEFQSLRVSFPRKPPNTATVLALQRCRSYIQTSLLILVLVLGGEFFRDEYHDNVYEIETVRRQCLRSVGAAHYVHRKR